MRILILAAVLILFGCSGDESASIENIRKELPKDYSASYSLGMHEIMVSKFKSHNVKFEIKEILNKTWVVWEKGQDERVEQAQKEADKEFLILYSNRGE